MISIDFETYSEVDITQAGVFVYAMHPSTEVLVACYSFDEGETVNEWKQGDAPPCDLINAVEQGLELRAWNSDFEELIWEHVCVSRLGWPLVDTNKWIDTMSLALSLALPGSLDKCADALDAKHKKNPEGKRLIRKFSMPRKPTTTNAQMRLYPNDAPEDFSRFIAYCADDVKTECAIYARLPRKYLEGDELVYYRHNKVINRRGVLLDRPAFQAVRRALAWKREHETNRLIRLTDGVVTSSDKLTDMRLWCGTRGYPMARITKDDVAHALQDKSLPEDVREVLTIRKTLGQVSTKKFERMAFVCGEGDRARGNITYHRASTGRNGGSGLQLHNFPRDYVAKDPKVIEDCIEFIGKEMYEVVETLYGDIPDVAKGLLRPMIKAPPGQTMFVADFSGVENRGTAWIANDPVGLKVFTDNRDQYREFAAEQFKIKPEEVSDERRTAAKATILGAIFGSGWKTIYETNVLRGIPMTEAEAQRNVADFREIYKETVETWWGLERSARRATATHNDVEYKGLKFGIRGEFLFIRLMSGRLLAYYHPKVESVETPWGESKMAVTYMGLTAQKKWMRLTLTPNRLIENVVSASCRDLLMHSRLLIEQDGRVTPVLDVHDEVVSYGDPEALTLDEYVSFLEQIPSWAYNYAGQQFPLKAEGYTSLRYKK